MYLKFEKWFGDFLVRNCHWSCSIKKLFLKISQNIYYNASMGVSFLIKESCNLIKKINSGKSVFSAKFWRTSFLQTEAATIDKKGILKNFASFTAKHLCWSLFLINLQWPEAYNFIKKRFQHSCFPVKFGRFLRTTVLKNICQRLPPLAASAQ